MAKVQSKQARRFLAPEIAQAKDKKWKAGLYHDGEGLYLKVAETGSASWLWRGQMRGKRRELGLGSLEHVSLKEARRLAAEKRAELGKGIVPVSRREAVRAQAAAIAPMTVAEALPHFLAFKMPQLSNGKAKSQWPNTFRDYVLPLIGDRPIASITRRDVKDIMEQKTTNARSKKTGPFYAVCADTASKVRGRVDAFFVWATDEDYFTGDNPATDVAKSGKYRRTGKKGKQPALPAARIPYFFSKLRAMPGNGSLAVQFAIFTASRYNETAEATWKEFDIANATWVIPEERMKGKPENRKMHMVPLSQAALSILAQLPTDDRDPDAYVFPGADYGTCLSDSTLGEVIRRLHDVEVRDGRDGFTDPEQLHEITGEPRIATMHGTARATFRTWTGDNVEGVETRTLEFALAHGVRDKAEASYARGTHFDKRAPVMEAWGDYCLSHPL